MPFCRSIRALSLLFFAAGASAQTTNLLLDGSLPHGRTDDITVAQPGPSYTVGEEFGWRAGTNLFHSFLEFDIGITDGVPDTVTFTSDPVLPALDNVITRVTGGSPSDIDGNLISEIETADFYFLNPAGVVFGGSSSVSVPQALHVSTAHRLDFANGDDFLDLLDKDDPTLSVEPPESFGFVSGGPRASISIGNPFAGSVIKRFEVEDGKTLSLVGGDVDVTGNFLQAIGGRVQVVAAGSAELTVPLDASQLEVSPGDPGLGDITFAIRSNINTLPFETDVPQGTIVIRGGKFELRDRSLAQAGGAIDGTEPGVDVQTSESVLITDRSELRAVRQGMPTSGGIHVSTGALTVSDRSFVRSRVLSFAPAGAVGGDITIDANTVLVDSDSQILSRTQASGANGAIDISADQVTLQSGALVSSLNQGSGAGSDVAITTDGLIVSDAELSATATSTGSAGDVIVVAPGGTVSIVEGGVVATQASGAEPGGNVSITAGTLEILGSLPDAGGETRESAIETATLGSADGGDIDLVVSELRIGASSDNGRTGRLATAVGAAATGQGGAIRIGADSVTVESGAQISTTNTSTAPGAKPAGNITITATGPVVVTGSRVDADTGLQPSGIFARAEGVADGGDISVSGSAIEISDAAEVSSVAELDGDSGSITLTASEAILVRGGDQASNVRSRGLGGAAGDVRLTAPSVAFIDGGTADVSAGALSGGLLRIETDTLLVSGESATGIPSSLAAQADQTGDALGIEIVATDLVRVEDSGVVSSITRGVGRPGDIRIEATTIEFVGAQGSAEATDASVAAGGNIDLLASDTVRISDGSSLRVQSSTSDDAGSLTVTAPRVLVENSELIGDSDAFGGNIVLEGTELIHVVGSQINAESRGGVSEVNGLAGGNITFTGGPVVVNRSVVSANGFLNANGGLVTITADPFLPSGDSSITATSELLVDGDVIVNSPDGEVTGDLAALPENFLDASSLLEEPCLAREAPSGSFAIRSTARVPRPPDAPLPSEPDDAAQCTAP